MAIDKNFRLGVIDSVKDLVGAEGVEFAKSLFTQDEVLRDFRERHTIITGIRNGKYVPIISQGNSFNGLSASTNDCSFNSCDLDTTYSLKKWVVGDYDCRIELCLRTLEENFWLFWGAYKQRLGDPLVEPDKYAFKSWLLDMAEKHIQGALWRTAYWGDTSSKNTLISQNNGFWANAEAGEGLKLTYIEPTNGQDIYNYLVDVYNKAIDEPWFDETTFKWRMSYKLAQKIVAWLNTLNDLSPYNCNCISANSIVARRKFTVEGLEILGLPVVAYKEHDTALTQGLGGKADLRALLISDENFLVGVNTLESLEQFRSFYEQKDDKVYMDLVIQIGTSIPKDEYALVKFNKKVA